MSRADKLGEILDGYDERLQQSWKSFLEGFEEKYCSVLNQFDNITKQKLVNGYHSVLEIKVETKNTRLVEEYYRGVKSLIDVKLDPVQDQAVIRTYVESVECVVRSMKP
jgi:hypothetical protein